MCFFIISICLNLFGLIIQIRITSAGACACQSCATLHPQVEVSLLQQRNLVPRYRFSFVVGPVSFVVANIAIAIRFLNRQIALKPLIRTSFFITPINQTVQQLFLGRWGNISFKFRGPFYIVDEAAVASDISSLELTKLINHRLRVIAIRHLFDTLLVNFNGTCKNECIVW